jgi:hypothetical protein
MKMEEHIEENIWRKTDGTLKTYLELQAENAAEQHAAGAKGREERARVLRQQAKILRNQAKLEDMYERVMAGLRDPDFKGPLADENIRLRKENAALKLEVESLQRALGTRERVKLTSDQLATSSSEL